MAGDDGAGEVDACQEIAFPHVLANLRERFPDVVAGAIRLEEVLMPHDDRKILSMHADTLTEIEFVLSRKIGEEPLETLHLFLGRLFDVKVPEHGDTHRASVPTVCMTADHSSSPSTPFVDLSTLVDQVVVADISPAAAIRMVRVERADALERGPLITRNILCRMVDNEEFD